MKRIVVLCIVLLLPSLGIPKSHPPRREFRGAWIASVANLDWPKSSNRSTEQNQADLIEHLDVLQASNIHAVMFQVRPECDALYESDLEPWSYWLTGAQGVPPNPYFDPLAFAVEEAHARGMELHAWFNPYRAVRSTGSYSQDATHVSRAHPEWILTFGALKMLNPGLPEVRDFVTDVILDVVRRYDVDGVHFDDYFYPYPPDHILHEDDPTFAEHSRGFTNQGDWRRDNVNIFIEMVHDSILAVKPYVKFGVSPFGIWKNGVPAGINGLDAYNTLYADPLAWIAQETVDYLSPQLYWPFGGGQDYGKLCPWWAGQAGERHLYIGQAMYRINGWYTVEMPNQLRLNRETEHVHGSIFFRATNFQENPRGFVDSLQTDFYRYPALPPVMAWKDDDTAPNPPLNLRYERLASTGRAGLAWDAPLSAGDGDAPERFVVYRFTTETIPADALEDPSHMFSLAGGLSNVPPVPTDLSESYYFALTSLDRNSNESGLSDMLYVEPPPAPVLASPGEDSQDLPPEIVLNWEYPIRSSFYDIQVSADEAFGELSVEETALADTFLVVNTLQGQETYSWRVRASNAGGLGPYSDVRHFSTGFPALPVLSYPPDNTGDIPLDTAYVWEATPGADTYRLQIAKSFDFSTANMLVDTTGLADTTYTGIVLEQNRFHFFRVMATNVVGSSDWSEISRFKTVDLSGIPDTGLMPKVFRLYANYPNPFNTQTTIPFDLDVYGQVTLKVYDMVGREVATLIDERMDAGHHEVPFEGSGYPSGVYFIRLIAGGRVLHSKMLLLK